MSDDLANFGALLLFDVDDPEFCRGFECGHIWTRLRDTDDRGPFTAHATNAEMLIRIGEALDLTFEAEDVGDGFLEVTYEP